MLIKDTSKYLLLTIFDSIRNSNRESIILGYNLVFLKNRQSVLRPFMLLRLHRQSVSMYKYSTCLQEVLTTVQTDSQSLVSTDSTVPTVSISAVQYCICTVQTVRTVEDDHL